MGERLSTSQRTTAARLLQCVRPYWPRAALGMLTFLATGATVLALGHGVRTLIDRGFHPGGAAGLRRSALELLALVTVYGAAGFGRTYLAGFIGDRVATDLRQQVLRKLLGHGPGFFETEGTSLLWSRVGSDTELIQSMLAALVSATRNALIVLGGLIAMVSNSVPLTALVLVMAPAITVSLVFLGAGIRRLSNASQHALARANAFALEAIDGIRIVKAFSQESNAADRFDGLAEETFRFATRRNLTQGAVNGVAIWLIFGSAIFLVWVAGEQVVAGRASEGQATAFMFYALVVAGSGAALSDTWSQIQKGVGAAERVFGLLDGSPRIRSPAAPVPLGRTAKGAITFDRVCFRYPARPEVAALDGLDLNIAAGAVTAIVGPSGAGKSTLFQLLLRLYDPDEGEVRLGGVDLRRLDLDELRSRIAIVPQEPTLFEGTLLENIRFGRRDAGERDVADAAAAAQAMEFIQRLPEGLATQVGPRGAQLSGGQKQRIAIARAILRNPAILLLDEATNALDARSEALIQTALATLAEGRTTLVIAHKLATVRRADAILVMDHGRLVSSGSHAQLLAEDGLYARFAGLQLV
jgi:ATP-binding cassette subfamily B protein